ncbi:MAG: hypothetical protein M3N43_05400 [Actinomycetota bacterium]|nr:hypothetical protein [Actinomycetota bacterium]
MNRTIASTALALLMVAACGGGTETTTTVPGTTTTSTVSTSTSTPTSVTLAGSTTTDASGATDPTAPPTVPPVIAQIAFAFAGGTTPRIGVTVAVGESPDGPWWPAGFSDDTPTLTGSSFWVQFTIANLDSLGVVTDVDLSGIDGSVIGEDVCSLDAPIPIGGAVTCTVGGSDGFPVEPGGAQNDFIAIGEGVRQGTALERYFQPPITSTRGYADAPHSFLLIFDTEEGAGVDGTSGAAEVEVDVAGLDLSRPVRVDCSDRFPGGRSSTGGSPTESEPALVAYVIENFSDGGDSLGGCSEIPLIELTYELDGSSDTAFLYLTP